MKGADLWTNVWTSDVTTVQFAAKESDEGRLTEDGSLKDVGYAVDVSNGLADGLGLPRSFGLRRSMLAAQV